MSFFGTLAKLCKRDRDADQREQVVQSLARVTDTKMDELDAAIRANERAHAILGNLLSEAQRRGVEHGNQ